MVCIYGSLYGYNNAGSCRNGLNSVFLNFRHNKLHNFALKTIENLP